MSDGSTDTTPSGTGEKKVDVSVDVDPQAVEELFGKHGASSTEDEKTAAKSGKASHKISVDVSGMTWGEVQSKLGTTTFLPDMSASLTPQDSNGKLQTDVHADLIQQKWADIGGVDLTSKLGGDIEYTDGSGVGGKLDLTQDIKFKQATLEATLETDFSGGSPKVTGTVGLKFEF